MLEFFEIKRTDSSLSDQEATQAVTDIVADTGGAWGYRHVRQELR